MAPAEDPLLRLCKISSRYPELNTDPATTFDATTFHALIRAGHPATARDEKGFTPLMHAVRHRSVKEVQALLGLPDADPRAQTNDGATALMIAVQWGRNDLIDTLLPVSDPHQQDTNGPWTALYYAALWDQQTWLDRLVPLATPNEMVDAIELCIVNTKPFYAQVLTASLPEEALPAACQMVERQADEGTFMRTAMEAALQKREHDVLAQHLRNAVQDGLAAQGAAPSSLPSAPSRPRL